MNDRADIIPTLEAQHVPDGLRLLWFGGPSYALKSPRTLVYVDPFKVVDGPEGFKHAIPNYIFPETIKRADVVISTHFHQDHCDEDTLRPIYDHTAARFAAAPSSAKLMSGWGFSPERVRAMPPGSTLQSGDVTLTSYPNNDWEDTEAVTFVLQSGGRSVFIGGDTMYFDGLEQIGREHTVDLAIFALARNRRDLIDQQLYFTPAELARAARAVGARRVLPIHWDIWEAWREDPHAVAPHLAGSGIELVVLNQGDTLDV